MRMRTRRKWWFGGMLVALPGGRVRLCGPRRVPPRPVRGGWGVCPRKGGGWLEGPGCNLAARWRADLVGSGVRGRCEAAVSAFWV